MIYYMLETLTLFLYKYQKINSVYIMEMRLKKFEEITV